MLNDNIHVLMTVYDEAKFLRFAYGSVQKFPVTVVEGAYRESIAVGASPRSTDGTLEILKDIGACVIQANELTDKDQRNVGLESIKKESPNTQWLLIVDGDEVYRESDLCIIQALTKRMERENLSAAYFKSLTFVNDFDHYCEQRFPRLFRITPDCHFVNDNFMSWPDKKREWTSENVIYYPQIAFHHYSFCKGRERFELKKKWWETRFPNSNSEYSWNIDSNGTIADPGHKILPYSGRHPEIIREHIENETRFLRSATSI